MTKRQEIAILTAIARAQNPALDRDTAVQTALTLSRRMSETELRSAVGVIVKDARRTDEVLVDVDFAVGMYEAFGEFPEAS